MPRKNDDDNPKFRLRPGKPPIPRERRSSPTMCAGFPDDSEIRAEFAGWAESATGAVEPVLLSALFSPSDYATNRVTGHWRAHGRYIERESASLQQQEAGFSAETNWRRYRLETS